MKSLQDADRQVKIVDDILSERNWQDAKWGIQNHHPFSWVAILGEEYGEMCQAALKLHFSDDIPPRTAKEYRKELIEVAAVAFAAIENLDRNSGEIVETWE